MAVVCLSEYAGPTPPKGSGPHRYQLLLFEQQTENLRPEAPKDRGNFDVNKFVRDNHLCNKLVGEFQFEVTGKNE